MASSTILHVDINSYFATLLQQKYPSLRGRPVGVVKETGRTCIIAASKEAKALGIKTGDSSLAVRRFAPHLILVPAEFDFYLDATLRLKSLFESFTPDVEIFSLDEAFLDITHCRQHLYSNPFDFAHHLQAQIHAHLGEYVTANVGIGPNRFLAKLVSEVSPKGSIRLIGPHNQEDYLASASFADICGIGFRLEYRLQRLGITSLYALNFVSDIFLRNHFGPFWSRQLRRMSQGLEPHLFSLIDKNPHAKSVGRSITGYRLEDDEAHIKAILYNLCQEVIHKARALNLAGRQISLSIYGPNHQRLHQHLTLQHFVSHTQEMFHYLYYQLYQSLHRPFPLIKFAVRLSLLKPVSELSASLLPSWQKQEKISLALDKINHRYGLFTVHSGLLANRSIIQPEVTGFLGDKSYQFRQ